MSLGMLVQCWLKQSRLCFRTNKRGMFSLPFMNLLWGYILKFSLQQYSLLILILSYWHLFYSTLPYCNEWTDYCLVVATLLCKKSISSVVLSQVSWLCLLYHRMFHVRIKLQYAATLSHIFSSDCQLLFTFH